MFDVYITFNYRKAPSKADEIQGMLRAYSDSVVTGQVRRLIVDRSKVWQSTLAMWRFPTISRRTGQLLVKFRGDNESIEPSADAGGPRREFFTWLLRDLINRSGLFNTGE